MGLLTTGGRPLDWGEEEFMKAIPHIKEHGVTQLLNVWRATKNDHSRPFLWGEEIESVLCVLDEDIDDASSSSAAASTTNNSNNSNNNQQHHRTTRVSMRAKETIDWLTEHDPEGASWQPEYASYMVENVPKHPYTILLDSLASVQDNMQHRYDAMNRACVELDKKYFSVTQPQGQQHQDSSSSSLITTANGDSTASTTISTIKKRTVAVTLVSFPLLGAAVDNFIDGGKDLRVLGKYAKSLFIPDECTNQTHPRFSYLTQNIRLRRGRKVCIQVPMFIDVNTLRDTVDKEFSIDWHPNNSKIDCAPDPDKAKKTQAFSSSSDDDDDDNDDDDKNNRNDTKSNPSPNNNNNNHHLGELVVKNTFADTFRHLYTPSTHYFFAQYVNLDQEKEAQVMERFNACPCPTPVRQTPCIYMDSMCFGMGLNCLQVTMQWQNMSECRHMYDQLVPIAPLFLALSSATPFQKGILCDSDVRWLTISASVDCRMRSEVPRIIKSRYDNVSMYISDRTVHLEEYNDERVETDAATLKRIEDAGVDTRLATHFAHLFIRDPLVIFDQMINVDDNTTSVHFENIQSTNWQSMRFKPPPPGQSDIGWRTELRTMDIQLSAFENAAFSAFSALLAKAVQKYNLFFTIPMSLVSMNMGAAHMRDPVNTQQFWWRSNCGFTDAAPKPTDFVRMTLNELFNGSSSFEGFVPLVRRFIKDENLGHNPRVEAFIDLISRRASGELKTGATFLREFVMKHPTYKKDSRLTKEIAHDIVLLAEKLGRGDTAIEGFIPSDLLMAAKGRRNRQEES